MRSEALSGCCTRIVPFRCLEDPGAAGAYSALRLAGMGFAAPAWETCSTAARSEFINQSGLKHRKCDSAQAKSTHCVKRNMLTQAQLWFDSLGVARGLAAPKPLEHTLASVGTKQLGTETYLKLVAGIWQRSSVASFIQKHGSNPQPHAYSNHTAATTSLPPTENSSTTCPASDQHVPITCSLISFHASIANE